MRTWMSIAGLLLALAIGGMLVGLLGAVVWVGATDDDPEVFVALPSPSASGVGAGSPDPATGSATATAIPSVQTPTVVPLEPIAISGGGDRTEPVAALSPGIVVITSLHQGDGAIEIVLERGDDEPPVSLANGRGTWDGSRAVLIREGQQPVLVVQASGPWEVTFERPVPVEANLAQLPFEQSGTGSRALYYVEVPQGTRTLFATHSGDGQFVVTMMNETGRGRVKLVDAPGAYDNSVAFESRFFPASYLILDVRARGDWTIRIE